MYQCKNLGIRSLCICVCFHIVQGTQEQWQIVFWLSGSIYLFGWAVFSIFGSGEIQPWGMEPEEISLEISSSSSEAAAAAAEMPETGCGTDNLGFAADGKPEKSNEGLGQKWSELQPELDADGETGAHSGTLDSETIVDSYCSYGGLHMHRGKRGLTIL